jgi:methylenetetrahydrofolate dehydrogenase (NADP+)/methenyltetrahydrofolate cyclohydrolase
MPTILDGKKVAEALYSKLILQVSMLSCVPRVVFVVAGNNPASQTYVRSKGKKCADLGLRSDTLQLPDTVSEDEMVEKIRGLNRDKDVHGILVQLPLPAQLNKNRILREIDPLKDVDGLHPENMGRLLEGDPRFVACTPAGVLEILRFYNIPLEGAKVVIVGRSEIVGKPAAQLMLLQNATVTICHSKTRDLARETAQADILIVAMGRPKFVGPAMVKDGAVVIDVGIHRVGERLCGDVDFDAVAPKTSFITPVPGGVGPMTIASLMKNLILAATLKA